MIKYLLVSVVALTLNFLSLNILAQSGPSPIGLEAVDTEIAYFMEEWNLPGGSVAVVKDGRLVYVRAFGRADINVPMETDHLFRIASLSKPITAIAILKLVENGSLSLNDKVFGENGILNGSTYQHIYDKRVEEITVKHLLQHTAGWDRNWSAEGDPMFNSVHIAQEMGVPAPAGEVPIIQYMLTKKLDFDPGSRFAYSNLGYSILGRIIEKVTRTTYEEYVLENILDPLEIQDMSLGCNMFENKQPKEVVYYAQQKARVPSVCEVGKEAYYPYGGFNIEAMDAHGGWVASVTDLAKIVVASSGAGTKRDLLAPETVALMMSPSQVSGNYGLGWCVNNRGSRWHTGSLVGASSMMASLGNGIGWVMLFNGNALSTEYFQSMDRVMWKALSNIKEWPSQDLFLNSEEGDSPKSIEGEIVPDLL